VATLLGWVPRPLRDLAYGLLARNRYRLFGRLDACPVPGPEQRERFIEG
jgi:predicted DCC family thiol-disulfide oxidoreductase YuxK